MKSIEPLMPVVTVDLGINQEAVLTLMQNALACNSVTAWKIHSKEHLEVTKALLVQVLQAKDKIDEAEKSAIGPLNKVVATIRGWWRPGKNACENLIYVLKTAIDAYDREERAIQKANWELAVKAHEAGNQQLASQALAVAASTTDGPGPGMHIRRKWVATIINPGMVPYEWCDPSERRLNQHAGQYAEDQEPYPIPGVRFELEGTVYAQHGKRK